MTLCAYCQTRPAVNRDHVVPRSLVKKLQRSFTVKYGSEPLYARRAIVLPPELLVTVPSCFECNMLKGTRRLVPPSWADKVPILTELLGGVWRVWNGDTKARAYRAVYR